MPRGDLLEVFACLDVNDLKRVAENAVALSLGAQIDTNDEVRQVASVTDVHVDGSRAWGTRVHAPGSSDDVEFVRRKNQWYIKLISRRRP